MGEILTNSFSNLIVEKKIGISYNDDPAPQVGIENFGNSAIEVGVRYWVPTKSYYQVMYAVNKEIYQALKTANINIPYPQQVVHLTRQDN